MAVLRTDVGAVEDLEPLPNWQIFLEVAIAYEDDVRLMGRDLLGEQAVGFVPHLHT